MARATTMLLALVALFALAATVSAGGDQKYLPYTAPCTGGACSALAALDEVKYCKEDGCADETCGTAVDNLCTLVTGHGQGCDLAKRTDVNNKDQILNTQINAVIPDFFNSANVVLRPGTQLLFGQTVINQVARYAVEATCQPGEIAIGGKCPGISFTGFTTPPNYNPVGGIGPYPDNTGTIAAPTATLPTNKYQCLYDITSLGSNDIGNTITAYAYALCTSITTYPYSAIQPSVCDSDPFNPKEAAKEVKYGEGYGSGYGSGYNNHQ